MQITIKRFDKFQTQITDVRYKNVDTQKYGNSKWHKKWLARFIFGFIFGSVSTVFSAIPALGAERISISSPLGEFTIPVSSLETYAKTGKVDDELGYYARFVKPEELGKLREILNSRVDLTPVIISQFLYSSIGETSLQFLGGLIQTESRLNGFYALRSSLILASTEKEGLNVLNVLKRFPSPTIRVSTAQAFTVFSVFTQLLEKTQKVTMLISEQSKTEVAGQELMKASPNVDLAKPGEVKWQKQTFNFIDDKRNRTVITDLYLPEINSPAPVIVISHGVGDNRRTFAYLGEHLASHGFAVVALEHPASNTQQLQNLIQGAAREVVETSEFIDRPLDVSFVLDEITRLNQSSSPNQSNFPLEKRLNLEQIGILGHSFGGYTAFALGGAEFNFKQLQQECRADNSNLSLANVSLLLQCLALELPQKDKYNLQDKRIRAVFAMNPAISGIFGEAGVSKIQVPVMIFGGTDDAVTPALVEQICPFTWLKVNDKYLAQIRGGTHVYDNSGFASGAVPVPSVIASPNPELARRYVKIMSLAFAKTYIAQESQYQSFLNASYAETISEPSLPIKLVRSLTNAQLSEKLKFSCPGTNTSK
ncbi:MAG: alpha/beta hydrolase [Scytonematopsis contorta HA4267-MV1]|jgi:predicted dienelactone hydrolase|nr:alpha/beta hydrolase [Scytonematopsis contorta HA4267-MV1]